MSGPAKFLDKNIYVYYGFGPHGSLHQSSFCWLKHYAKRPRGPMRFIRDLSPETQHLLRRGYKESQHHRVRQRAHCILLSFEGKTTTELMDIFHVERLTLYHWFDAWETRRFAGLYAHKGRGRPPKLTDAEQEKAHQYIAQHPQNMKKVVHLLEQETSKRVSTKTLKRLLKKTAMSGNVSSTHQRRVRTLYSTSGAKP
jgi:transposase